VAKANDTNLAPDEIAIILNKAVKAQLKAHGLHNLPLYLFHAACTYQLAGNYEKADVWFKNFLLLQSEFKPDKADEINLKYLVNMQGFSVAEAIEVARMRFQAK
jgi:hypothetical protein